MWFKLFVVYKCPLLWKYIFIAKKEKYWSTCRKELLFYQNSGRIPKPKMILQKSLRYIRITTCRCTEIVQISFQIMFTDNHYKSLTELQFTWCILDFVETWIIWHLNSDTVEVCFYQVKFWRRPQQHPSLLP